MFGSPKFMAAGGGGGDSILHQNYPTGQIHTPYNWVVANAAARAALVLAPEDVYKVLYQVDSTESYVLLDDSPATWQLIGSSPLTAYDPFSRWTESLLEYDDAVNSNFFTDKVIANRVGAFSANLRIVAGGLSGNALSATAGDVSGQVYGPKTLLTDDFTVEGFVNVPALGVARNLVAIGTDAAGARVFLFFNASNQLTYDRLGIAQVALTGTTLGATNTWIHWHWSRHNQLIYGGINGIGTNTVANGATLANNSNVVTITANSLFKQDSFRYTHGRARYASGNYTPPVPPYLPLTY